MKRVCNGLIYNTKTADEVCYILSGLSRFDHAWHSTRLYCTPKGRFFLAGRGGPRSLWGEPLGNNGWTWHRR
jgi:hypothetical protein